MARATWNFQVDFWHADVKIVTYPCSKIDGLRLSVTVDIFLDEAVKYFFTFRLNKFTC